MPVFINGLVIPDGFRAVAFKRSTEDCWYVEVEILQIRIGNLTLGIYLIMY